MREGGALGRTSEARDGIRYRTMEFPTIPKGGR